jgi:hypothetical protein
MCPVASAFRDRAISLYGSKTVDKKEIFSNASNVGICCSSDKGGTIYIITKNFLKFQRQHRCSLGYQTTGNCEDTCQMICLPDS